MQNHISVLNVLYDTSLTELAVTNKMKIGDTDWQVLGPPSVIEGLFSLENR